LGWHALLLLLLHGVVLGHVGSTPCILHDWGLLLLEGGLHHEVGGLLLHWLGAWGKSTCGVGVPPRESGRLLWVLRLLVWELHRHRHAASRKIAWGNSLLLL
jgi:hypothetical protein